MGDDRPASEGSPKVLARSGAACTSWKKSQYKIFEVAIQFLEAAVSSK